MREFPTEKDVPIPQISHKDVKYPWRVLEIGDSFFIENGKMSSIAGSKDWAQKQLRRKFTARTVEGGIRVWRIK